MAIVTQLFRPLTTSIRSEFVCSRCLQFSTCSALRSGHNRWSKIKHDKGSADAKKNVQRSALSHEITMCSKLYGGDPSLNPKLAAIIAIAKKASLPKETIEKALLRGQGKSSSGAALEYITLEVMMPNSIAVVIEMETDNRKRTLSELRVVIKFHGGNVTPTSYLFQKKGRILFEQDERNLGVDDVLDDAIEAGAEDVETDEDGSIVVWTEPASTTAAAAALAKSKGLKVQSSDIIWDPNEDTIVSFESQAALQAFTEFVDQVQQDPSVQGIYANIAQGKAEEGPWADLMDKLAV